MARNLLWPLRLDFTEMNAAMVSLSGMYNKPFQIIIHDLYQICAVTVL